MFAKTRLALMIGCITSGVSLQAMAQDTPTAASKSDTVVVTSTVQSGATKLETPDIETPQSVSIVTREQFEEQGANSVRQAVSYTPGVFSDQIGASNRFDYIVLRGFSDGSLDNLYLDGLKIMGDTNSHSSLVIDPWFLDSIEVVRGPASVLYGRSSPGGIVAMNSRMPSFDAGGQVKVFAGNNKQRGAAFDVTGPLDDNDRVAFRLGGMTRFADTQFGTKEERYAFAPSLTWRITDQTRLDLMAYIHRDPEGGSHSGLPYEGTVVRHAGQKISSGFFEGEDDYDKYDRRENMVGYNIEHAFDSGWSARQKLRYLHTKVELNQVWSGGWINDTDLSRGYAGSDESLSAITIDNQLDGSVDTGDINHRLLVGVDYQRRSNNTNSYSGDFAPINAFKPVYGAQPLAPFSRYASEKHKLDQTGVYAQDQLSWDRWRLTLGGRYDRVNVTNVNKLDGTRDTIDQGNFSSRAALLYLFDNGFAPYVSYSTAFTPTSFVDAEGNILDPMKGKQWEAGMKYQPEGSDTQYSASVFRINQTNVATKDNPDDPYRAIGEIESKGVELEAVGNLTDNLRLQAAYTYTDVRYKKSGPAEQGRRAIYAPRNQASAWLSYDVKSGPLDGLTVGSGVRYVNGVASDRANTHTLPSYTVMDLAVGYDLSNVGLKGLNAQLNINNLTDKRYVSTCNSLSYCYFGAERSIVGSLSYSF